VIVPLAASPEPTVVPPMVPEIVTPVVQVPPNIAPANPAAVVSPQVNQTMTDAMQEIVIPASTTAKPASSANSILIIAQFFFGFAVQAIFSS